MRTEQRFLILFTMLLSGCAVAPRDDAADSEALAHSDSALCKNALSSSQEKIALKLVDDICGDTWCEGDNDFAFENLTCRAGAKASPNGGTCTLRLRIIPREDNPPSYMRECITGGFHGFASLVETAPSGYQSLNWDYYLALTDCIGQLEAKLPR